MDPHPVTSRRSVAGILRPGLGFLLAAAAALLLRSPLAAAPAEDPPPACIECHDDAAASFAEGSHRILPKSLRTDPAGTCALCHGPADPRHAESGGKEGVVGFSKIEPDAMAAACARCHTHHPDHVKDWKTSEYRENGLACAECHKVHEKSSAGIHLPVADAGRGVLGAESCRVCHVDVVEAAPASLHGKVMADPHLDSCEMCHAGGAKHVEAVRAPAAPAGAGFAKERTCLLCHSQMPERHRKELLPSVLKGFPSPLTAANCTSCHDPHLPKARTAAGLGLAAAPDAAALEKAGAKPVGAPVCATCHAGFSKEFPATLHGKALWNLADRACESCHGPGSLHLETGGSRRAILGAPAKDAKALAAFCLSCHEKTAPDHAREFASHPYAKEGRTCASCHEVHAPMPAGIPEGGFRTVAETRAGSPAVGSAACAKCHEGVHPGIERSLHGPLLVKGRTPREGVGASLGETVGCESCHGNGGAHAAASGRKDLIVNPARLAGKAKDDACLECHETSATPAAWGRHPHGQAGIGCLSCHDPFGPAGTPAKAKQPELCASCHGIEVAQFRLPNHHPVEEGALRCSDCHDMHRPAPAAQAAAKWADTCANCHRAEATPRLHRHEADRTEGCIACHEPHGTTSPRMLKFSRVVDLCLSCHIPPPSHDMAAGGAYASCLACHTEIHGSDAHPLFLR